MAEQVVKIMVTGDKRSGKTDLVLRFLADVSEEYDIDSAMRNRKRVMFGNRPFVLQILDARKQRLSDRLQHNQQTNIRPSRMDARKAPTPLE